MLSTTNNALLISADNVAPERDITSTHPFLRAIDVLKRRMELGGWALFDGQVYARVPEG